MSGTDAVPLETVTSPPEQPTLALIDELLAEQQRLQTPVAAYSRGHDAGFGPAARQYRDLIPLTAPAPGEQYAFEVDLDSCSGCKACVAGCHALNGLDDNETWRDVGLMLGGDARHPFQQTITTACHHCADPGCLNGCPVLAYEKDPVTGIVRHLDDQCIGCSYCILKCPYDVPKYSERLGIVRKCDMCHGRLAEGEAPACVQACPTEAIRIVTVPVAGRASDTSGFLPGAPDPTLTFPTTRYVSDRPLPNDLRAADAGAPRVQPAHVPLAAMFLGTQLAVGLQTGALLADQAAGWMPVAAVGLGGAGLFSSVFHLGRPLRAWRIFLGLRRSWLSREAIVLGGWFALAAGALVFPSIEPPRAVIAGAGFLGLICSAMIYIDTGRRAWRAPATFARFLGTAAVAAAWVVSPAWGGVAIMGKLVAEAITVATGPTSSRLLLRGPLRRVATTRQLSGALGAACLLAGQLEPGAIACGAAVAVIGEWLEKRLFFRAVDPSRMPGLSAR